MVEPGKWSAKIGMAPRLAATFCGIVWMVAVAAVWSGWNDPGRVATAGIIRPVAFAGAATLFAVLWWSGSSPGAGRRIAGMAMWLSVIALVVLVASGVALMLRST